MPAFLARHILAFVNTIVQAVWGLLVPFRYASMLSLVKSAIQSERRCCCLTGWTSGTIIWAVHTSLAKALSAFYYVSGFWTSRWRPIKAVLLCLSYLGAQGQWLANPWSQRTSWAQSRYWWCHGSEVCLRGRTGGGCGWGWADVGHPLAVQSHTVGQTRWWSNGHNLGMIPGARWCIKRLVSIWMKLLSLTFLDASYLLFTKLLAW